MSKAGVKPDKETFQCLISRHCQVGDVEGAGKVLQMMKTEGIKVNENIFNSLIMGHGESGDLARAHGMLKVREQKVKVLKIKVCRSHYFKNCTFLIVDQF